MKKLNTHFQALPILLLLLGVSGYLQAQTERILPPPQEQPKTIMLTEEEYLELKSKAENPSCPAQQATLVRRGDIRGKKGAVIRLGGGISYLYGADKDANSTISSSFTNWYVEGMLGYTINSDQQGLGTLVGGFVNAGNFTQESLEKVINDGEAGLTIDTQDRDHRYYQGEVGFIFFETIRLSTGAGIQEYVDNTGENQQFNYYSTTAGLHFGARYFKVVVDVNFMYGRQLKERIYRPMVGIMFQL